MTLAHRARLHLSTGPAMNAFQELQSRVAESEALQERLQAAEAKESFIETVEEMARELGFDLDRETIRSGIEASTAAAASPELSDEDLANVAGGTLYVSYLCFGGGYASRLTAGPRGCETY